MPFATDSSCQSSWADTGVDTSTHGVRRPCSERLVLRGQRRAARHERRCRASASSTPSWRDRELRGPRRATVRRPGRLHARRFACDPGLHLAGHHPISAPRNSASPTVGGTVAVGQTITCDAGSWDNGPALDYQFVRGLDGRTTAALTNLGAQQSYVVTSADVGSQLACFVKAHNGGGLAYSQSAWTAAVPAAGADARAAHEPVAVADPAGHRGAGRADHEDDVHGHALHAQRHGHGHRVLGRDQDGAVDGALDLPQPLQAQGQPQDGRLHEAPHEQAERRGAHRHAVQGRGLQAALRHPALHLVAIDKAGHRQALPTTKTVTTKKPKKHR